VRLFTVKVSEVLFHSTPPVTQVISTVCSLLSRTVGITYSYLLPFRVGVIVTGVEPLIEYLYESWSDVSNTIVGDVSEV
jgi:hypothetical protein